MADRTRRLKELVLVQGKIRALHEARHAGLLSEAQAAAREAEEIAARSYEPGSLAPLFPELYARRVDAALQRRDLKLREAEIEAVRIATARLRTEKFAEAFKTSRNADDRKREDRERLEAVAARAPTRR